MSKLDRPFENIRDGKKLYYGGAQRWFEKTRLQKGGCGVIAGTQLIFHERGKRDQRLSIDKDEFMELADLLSRKYLLVLPYLGLSGYLLSWGLNRYFRKNDMGLKARWGCLPWNIWKKIDELLDNDIPAIISVGPNFPNINGKHRVNLYEKKIDGYVTVDRTKAHYVTVTATDEEWLTVSSWGRKYYINKAEYMKYVKWHSNWIFSNMLKIEQMFVKL